MITGVEIGLVAGFLEGEGHFRSNSSKGSCRIVASSTDRDVIEKVARIMGATISGPYPPNIGSKEKWVLQVATSAPEWMMTLYPLLGQAPGTDSKGPSPMESKQLPEIIESPLAKAVVLAPAIFLSF